MDSRKSIKIKTKATGRLVKDVQMYMLEVEEEKAKLATMEAKPEPDKYAIKQQKEVIGESEFMVPDSLKRLKEMMEDLEMELEAEDDNEELMATEEYKAGVVQLKEAKEFIEKT